jgi:hypothetical protein
LELNSHEKQRQPEWQWTIGCKENGKRILLYGAFCNGLLPELVAQVLMVFLISVTKSKQSVVTSDDICRSYSIVI